MLEYSVCTDYYFVCTGYLIVNTEYLFLNECPKHTTIVIRSIFTFLKQALNESIDCLQSFITSMKA